MLTEMADGDPLASPHAAVALVAALVLGPSLGRGGQALLGVLLLLYLQTIAAQHAATQRSRLELHTLRALSHRSAAAEPRHTPHATRHAPRATRHAPRATHGGHRRRRLVCRRQLVGRHESAAWLNALIASGWASTLGPLLEQSLRDEIRASLAELPLPRSLRSVH